MLPRVLLLIINVCLLSQHVQQNLVLTDQLDEKEVMMSLRWVRSEVTEEANIEVNLMEKLTVMLACRRS